MQGQLPISSPARHSTMVQPDPPGFIRSPVAQARPSAHRQSVVDIRESESAASTDSAPHFFHSHNPCWRYATDNPLHCACIEGDIKLVRKLLKQCPEATSERASDGDLPIHRAAASSSPHALEIVKLLLELAPNHLTAEGMDGEHPLHVACACAPSSMLVHHLITLRPETVNVVNKRGDLPVHRACMNRGPERDTILKALIDTVPETVKVQGAQGHLPLHRACLCSGLGSVKYLIGRYPDGLREVDSKGQVPCTHSINLTHPLGPPIVPRAVDVLCPCSC